MQHLRKVVPALRQRTRERDEAIQCLKDEREANAISDHAVMDYQLHARFDACDRDRVLAEKERDAYRDNLDAALVSASALEAENEALKKERDNYHRGEDEALHLAAKRAEERDSLRTEVEEKEKQCNNDKEEQGITIPREKRKNLKKK